MPEITPMLPEGTLTMTANTQMPSAKLTAEKESLATEAKTPQSLTPESTGASSETTPQSEDAASLDQKKLRVLLQREKQWVNAKKKLDLERKELEQQKSQSRQWIEAAELAKENKLEALAKLGITYDDLTQQILNNGQLPPGQIAELKAQEIVKREIEAFKQEQLRQAEEAQRAQYSQGLSQVANELKDAVEKEAEKYPLVKLDESYNDIAKWIESEFHRTGRITPVEEALERWENEALSGLEELFKIDKVRNKAISKDTPSPAIPHRTESVPSTLSQRATAPIPSPKSLTAAERRQRAIDAFYGRLP